MNIYLSAKDFQKWLVLLHLSSITLLAAAQPKLLFSLCGQTGNYEHKSTYQHNLNTLLSSISSKLDEYGFYNASNGQNPDKVSVVALCRGDIEPKICRSCVDNATRKMVQVCPNEMDAFGGYDECMIRYSNNESTVGSWSRFPQFYFYIESLTGTNNSASRPAQFNQDLRKLLDGLRDRAANGFPLRKFAAGNTSGPDFQTTYAAVQCSPDLSAQHCSDCLTSAFGDLPRCLCYGNTRGRIIRPSCNFRYESYRFFNYFKVIIEAPPPKSITKALPAKSGFEAPPPKSVVLSQAGKGDNKIRIIIVIVVPVAVVFIVLTICVSIIVLRKRQKRKQKNDKDDSVDDASVVELLKYDFGSIKTATNNFSNSNKLGQGGFGLVYKGKLNGREVAVKRLSHNSGQGDHEFKNEVHLVAKLQHRNLVRLLGFCLKKRERLLVYEFVPNASLDRFLFDPVKRAYLDWETRYKIIGGISRGLLYLHEDSRYRIIHRDLKASNILLDAEMNPKISDFGMARLFALEESEGTTSRIMGTYGYMAPEYAFHGQFSAKSDVFSFGVLVLEILSGQNNTCFRNGKSKQDLLSYAWTQWQEGTTMNLVDPILRGKSGSSVQQMMKCIHMAMLCVQENVIDRPTMSTIVLMLCGSSLSLPLPSAPPFFMHSTTTTSEVLPQLQEHNSRVLESINEASSTDL